jgi:hypothetical protein
MVATEPGPEHRIVDSELMNSLTMQMRYTCACGWEGHSTRWYDRDHGENIPPLPSTSPPPRISREELRRAIYGDRRRRYR